MSSFNKLPKRTDQSLDMDSWVNINRQAKKLNNIQFDPYDFQVSNDSTGIFVALNEQTGSGSEQNTNFTIDQIATNTTSGQTTFDVHGGRLYFASNGATKILEGDPSFFGGVFFNYWSNVYSANTTSDGFICAKIDSNTNPTNYTIEIKALPYSSPPSPPDYFPLGYVNIATNTDSAYITQLMIGDVTWANVSGNTSSTVVLDNLSINNNSAGKVQIYGFEHAVNTSTACVLSDVMPFKRTDNPGEHIYWATIEDIANATTNIIDCDYINQCVSSNSAAVFCTTINNTTGHDCLCNWLAANPTCIPAKIHNDLTFTPSSYDKAGDNMDHSGVYWQRGTRGSNNSAFSQNYGSSIGNSSAYETINLDNTYLVSNAYSIALNWTTNKLNGDWATTGKHTASEFDVASSTTILSDLKLTIDANTKLEASKLTIDANTKLEASKLTLNTTNYWDPISTAAATAFYANVAGGITLHGYKYVSVNSATEDITLRSYSKSIYVKADRDVYLDPTYDLHINDTPGKTITSWFTKGIMTGTIGTYAEYQITANVAGTPTTFTVLGRT